MPRREELATLLSIQELSSICNLSVTQLRRHVKAERIPFIQPGGRGGKLLFELDAVLEALRATVSESKRRRGPRPRWEQ